MWITNDRLLFPHFQKFSQDPVKFTGVIHVGVMRRIGNDLQIPPFSFRPAIAVGANLARLISLPIDDQQGERQAANMKQFCPSH